MKTINDIYDNITELHYKLKTKNVVLLCKIKQHDKCFKWKGFEWIVYLERYNLMNWDYYVELERKLSPTLDTCVEELDNWISKNFIVE